MPELNVLPWWKIRCHTTLLCDPLEAHSNIRIYNSREIDFGMPRILKTVLPRIRKSLAQKGIAVTALRSVLLPFHMLKEYKAARELVHDDAVCEFDLANGVETEGDLDGWTYLSDLDISSPNWISGNNYLAIEPERFSLILSTLPIAFEEFVFIDFGSGKGRALLMASEMPFKRIVGVEFSKKLHSTAEQNFARYQSPTQKCKRLASVCMDFIDFELPAEPAVLFFFDPCDETILARVLEKVGKSLQASLRPIYLAYVAGSSRKAQSLNSADFLTQVETNEKYDFCVYKANKTVQRSGKIDAH
jgi:hypothetical protein